LCNILKAIKHAPCIALLLHAWCHANLSPTPRRTLPRNFPPVVIRLRLPPPQHGRPMGKRRPFSAVRIASHPFRPSATTLRSYFTTAGI
jgi:hypothetical protein